MAISAGMALMSTATTALTGGTLMGGFLVGGTGTLLTHFLVTTAMGAAINALSPKPQTQASGYNVTATGSALDHQIIYGQVKVYGARVFDHTTGENNKTLHRVLAFAGHEIQSYETFYINDGEVTGIDGSGNVTEVTLPDGTTTDRYDGYVTIKEHLGSADQVADPDLVSNVTSWTNDHRLRGIAYLYVKLAFNPDVFPNGVPEISAKIKGKKVYDPRTSTTAWSNNPALCVRDYLTNVYGLNESSGNIDDTVVQTTANVCDYYNYPTLTGNQRYTCNGAFTTGTTPYDILQALLSSMGGMAWYAQGKWRMKPAYWTSPVLSLTEDDLRSSIQVQTRHSRRDNFNTVNGTFRGEESNWQETDFPPVSNSAFVTADNNQESSTDLRLPFTDTSAEARRIANIYLEKNRQQLTVQASFGLRAFAVQVGDNVTLTNSRFGWSSKEFEVVHWSFGLTDGLDLQIQMTLRETAESVYDDISDGVVYERDNTELLSPFDVPSVGLSAEARLQILKEKLTNIISLTVTSGASDRIDNVEAQFKKSSDSDWKTLGTGELGIFEALDLEDGTYDFRARAVNTFGVKGTWSYLYNQQASGLAQPPSDISSFSIDVADGLASLEWEPVSDLDLSFYRIRHAVETTGATWANSTTAVNKIARPASSISLPARSGTYMIRPYDKSQITSENYTSVVVVAEQLDSFTNTVTQTEDPTFSGTKTDCSVSSSTLIITDPSSGPTEATYDFSTYIDTGSVRRVKARIDAAIIRTNNAGSDFEDLGGLFDDLSGLFDDLSGDQDFDDTNVEFYISTTPDDPAGTPTWSSYQKFRVGYFYGRAFRFRVVLKSNTDNVTPSITSLDAIVEYN